MFSPEENEYIYICLSYSVDFGTRDEQEPVITWVRGFTTEQ